MKLTPFETTVLEGWEDVYKKTQVSLWLLLAMREGERYVEDIRLFMKKHASIEIADPSLYRSLRRFEAAALAKSTAVKSKQGGPDKKKFVLTREGLAVLEAFLARNIRRQYFSTRNEYLFVKEKSS